MRPVRWLPGFAMQALVATIAAGPAYGGVSYIVNSLAENTSADGLCTLREAMLAANNAPANPDCGPGSAGLDSISIDVPGTIVLGAQLPTISDHVTISGHSSGNTLDGQRQGPLFGSRHFAINPSVDATFEKLTIANGRAPNGSAYARSPADVPGNGEDGGAIHRRGRLLLMDVRITHSGAGRGAAGGLSFAQYGTGTVVTPTAIAADARFTIDDGINPPVSVTTREPWRCLDPAGANPPLPSSLRR